MADIQRIIALENDIVQAERSLNAALGEFRKDVKEHNLNGRTRDCWGTFWVNLTSLQSRATKALEEIGPHFGQRPSAADIMARAEELVKLWRAQGRTRADIVKEFGQMFGIEK